MTAATVPRTTVDTLTRRDSSESKTPPCPACVPPMWPMLDDPPLPRSDKAPGGSGCRYEGYRSAWSNASIHWIRSSTTSVPSSTVKSRLLRKSRLYALCQRAS